MLSEQEWQDYEEYWASLTDEQKIIELEWLETIGQAKKRGSVVSCIENNTLQ